MSPEGTGAASPRGQRGRRGHLLAEHRGILELGESRHVRPRVARRSEAGSSLWEARGDLGAGALRAGGGRGTERRPVGHFAVMFLYAVDPWCRVAVWYGLCALAGLSWVWIPAHDSCRLRRMENERVQSAGIWAASGAQREVCLIFFSEKHSTNTYSRTHDHSSL
jgi:hypothetical protein